MTLQIVPYLYFDGKCAEAFAFYEKALDGKITFLSTFGESPMASTVPVEDHGAVMHATLQLADGQLIQGSDAIQGRYEKPASFSISASFDDVDKAHHVFKELTKGGAETMALQETFWAKAFGMLTDPYGIAWMINVYKPMN